MPTVRVALTAAAAAMGGMLCGVLSLYFIGLVWVVVVLAAFRIGRHVVGPRLLIAFGLGYSVPATPLGYFNAVLRLSEGDTAFAALYAAIAAVGPVITVCALAWSMRRGRFSHTIRESA
jgi:hypothetical protein